RRAVEQFAQQVAVPTDSEIDRGFGRRYLRSARPQRGVGRELLRGIHASGGAGSPHLVAAITRVDVERQSAADVTRSLYAEDQLTGARVAELGGVRAIIGGAFVRLENFESGPVGIHIRHMKRVAVSQARREKPGPVIINRASAVHYFVSSIVVHVAYAELVIALSAPRGVWIGRAGVAGVEGPDVGERAVAPVPGREHGASVITAGHKGAGPLAVEIGDARQEAIHAIAVTVAPIADSPARDDVARGGHSRAGLSIEDGQKFRTGENVAGGVAKIGVLISDYSAHAVNSPVGRLAGDLGLAVTVEIVNLKLRVVRACANVAPEGDAPRRRPIEFVSVELDMARVAGLRIVFRIRGVPFDDDLVLAVAVEIADAAVVRAVSVILARRRHARRRNL